MRNARIHESGPNIFEDLGLPNAATHMLKAQIVAELFRLATDGGISDAEAARRLGISKTKVDRMFRGDFRSYSVKRLMGFLTMFDRDVEIVARPRASQSESAGTITFRAA